MLSEDLFSVYIVDIFRLINAQRAQQVKTEYLNEMHQRFSSSNNSLVKFKSRRVRDTRSILKDREDLLARSDYRRYRTREFEDRSSPCRYLRISKSLTLSESSAWKVTLDHRNVRTSIPRSCQSRNYIPSTSGVALAGGTGAREAASGRITVGEHYTNGLPTKSSTDRNFRRVSRRCVSRSFFLPHSRPSN